MSGCRLLETNSALFDSFMNMIDKIRAKMMFALEFLGQAIIIIVLMKEDTINVIGGEFDLDNSYIR